MEGGGENGVAKLARDPPSLQSILAPKRKDEFAMNNDVSFPENIRVESHVNSLSLPLCPFRPAAIKN
jgi:hypothetical protein